MVVNRGLEYRDRIDKDRAGVHLVEYLARRYPKFPREQWLGRIRAGRVLVDGVPAREDLLLRPGQSVSWMRPPWEEPTVPTSFAILYRRNGLLGVAKPAGLPTMPGGGQFVENTLLARVRRLFPGASPLHRLGRATSGIVLFATEADAASAIAREWRWHAVVKVYRALASGCPARDEWPIDVPIGPVPHPLLGTVHAATREGKPAHSEVKVLARRDGCALVEVRIVTGRPHQIRIHLAAAGYPLVGDPLYATGGVPEQNCGAVPGDPGYHLHAGLLGFADPLSGAWVEISCLAPPLLR